MEEKKPLETPMLATTAPGGCSKHLEITAEPPFTHNHGTQRHLLPHLCRCSQQWQLQSPPGRSVSATQQTIEGNAIVNNIYGVLVDPSLTATLHFGPSPLFI